MVEYTRLVEPHFILDVLNAKSIVLGLKMVILWWHGVGNVPTYVNPENNKLNKTTKEKS